MIFVTGDTHTDWMSRLNSDAFPEGRTMTKDDYVIVCGDFGIWHDTNEEHYRLKWLNEKPFTTLFVCGNHENYDRLYQYPVEEWHGGKVHKINDSVFHLMRGQVFDIDGIKFFAFGGASSHDIQDGILEKGDPRIKKWTREFRRFRIGKKLVALNHYPMLEWNGSHRATNQEDSLSWLIHGHIHDERDSKTFKYIQKYQPCALNAGVDINHYEPVTFEELVENNNRWYERSVSKQ